MEITHKWYVIAPSIWLLREAGSIVWCGGIGVRQTWIYVLTLTFISRVTMSQLLDPLNICFQIYKLVIEKLS